MKYLLLATLVLSVGSVGAALGQHVLASPATLPRLYRWRVNDTLVLECSRPATTFLQSDGPAVVLWARIALRGRRGYYQVLSRGALYSLESAVVSPQGDILHLSELEPTRLPSEAFQPAGRPLPDYTSRFADYVVWDVRYRTWTDYLTADLQEWDQHQGPFFTGGVVEGRDYRLLPYWISQEQAHLARTHRLPPIRRLLAYGNLGQQLAVVQSSSYVQAYGPLLAQLLRAYRSYHPPAALAHRLDRSFRALTKRVHHTTPQ